MAGVAQERVALAELVARYLAVHPGAESTKTSLRWRLDKALATFGDVQPHSLTREEIERWRLTLPSGHRFETLQALKQAIRWGGEAGLLERHHPALDVKNPQPPRSEIRPFTWDEVDAIAEEIDRRWSPLIIFAAGTGLRPGEWAALEHRDLDLAGRAVTVSRRLTKDKTIIDETKNGRTRRVPLRPRVAEALQDLPPRLDTKLVFPAARGGYVDLHNWREDYWHPAMVSAGFITDDGKPDRGPYALRHTFATMALRAGLPTFDVARMMGTSLEMIDRTYGHFAEDSEAWQLGLLAAYDETSGRIVDANEAQR
jgi:integrase